MPQGHDELIWTWRSPTGQEFRGTPDYIEGVKTGWDASMNRRIQVKARRIEDEIVAPEVRGLVNIVNETAKEESRRVTAREEVKVIDKLQTLFELLKDLTDRDTATKFVEMLMHPRVVIPGHQCKYSALCGKENG